MDSIRVSEAPDSGSIPDETTITIYQILPQLGFGRILNLNYPLQNHQLIFKAQLEIFYSSFRINR